MATKESKAITKLSTKLDKVTKRLEVLDDVVGNLIEAGSQVAIGGAETVGVCTGMENRITCLEQGHVWQYTDMIIRTYSDGDEWLEAHRKCSRCGAWQKKSLGRKQAKAWKLVREAMDD
jgi:hypothetical protein